MDTIKQPDEPAPPNIRTFSANGASTMSINSLLQSLLAAYACGASGTFERPSREV